MLHKAAAHTAVGQVKKNNEDAFLIHEDLNLYMVCDGMGGRAAGEVASHACCDLLPKRMEEHRDVLEAYADEPSSDHRAQALMMIRSVIGQVSNEIYDMARSDPKLRGMGTTIVALIIAGKNAIVAHAGDSRAYLARGDKAYAVTDDHSVVMRQLQRGLITPEDALHSSKSHTVTRAVGLHEELEVDAINIELMPGDTYVLCSDGLSRYVTTEEIGRASSSFTLEQVPEALVGVADKRSGKDNISAVAIRIDPKQEVEGLNAAMKIDALRQISLFQNLSYKEAVRVLSVVASRSYEEGEQIIEQGSPGEEFFVGVVGRYRAVLDGQEIATLPAGSFFGEMSLITEEPRLTSVYAVEPSKVLVIEREDLFALMRSEPYLATKFLWAFCRVLTERLAHTGKQLASIKFESAMEMTPGISDPFDLSALARAAVDAEEAAEKDGEKAAEEQQA